MSHLKTNKRTNKQTNRRNALEEEETIYCSNISQNFRPLFESLRLKKKKRFRLEWFSNPWPLRYRCSALSTQLSSQLLLDSSVGRALHRHRRGRGSNPVQVWMFFQALVSRMAKLRWSFMLYIFVLYRSNMGVHLLQPNSLLVSYVRLWKRIDFHNDLPITIFTINWLYLRASGVSRTKGSRQ